MAGDEASDKRVEPELSGAGLRLAIVCGRFNDRITSRLLEGAQRRLKELEVADDDVQVHWMPGAFELPFAAGESDRRPQVGERVSGSKLLVCLIQMETNDWQNRRRGDRGERCDRYGPGSSTSAQPCGQVSKRENGEPSGPGEIGEQQRIARRKPCPECRWEGGARIGRWSERCRQRFTVCEPASRVTR